MAKTANVSCPDCGLVFEIKKNFLGWEKPFCTRCKKRFSMQDVRYEYVICRNCHNQVRYDIQKGSDNVCSHCHAKLISSLDEKTYAVTCPECQTTIDAVYGETSITCVHCGKTFNPEQMANKEKVASGPSLIKYAGDDDVLVWHHPVNQFAYKSQIVIGQDYSALIFEDGICKGMGKEPGRYLLGRSSMTREERFTEAMGEDSSVILHTDVYFVRNHIPGEIRFSATYRPILRGETEEYRPTVGCKAQLEVCDAEALLKKIGAKNHNVKDVVQEKLQVVLCDYINDVIGGLPDKVELEGWNPEMITEYRNEISVFLKQGISQKLMENFGLTISEFSIEMLKADVIPNILRQCVEGRIEWTSEPIRVHRRENRQMSAQITLGGSVSLFVSDLRQLKKLTEAQKWKSEANRSDAQKYFSTLICDQVTSIFTDILQEMINSYNLDIDEIERCFGNLRQTVSECIARNMALRGVRVEELVIRCKEIKRSMLLEKSETYSVRRTEAELDEEMRKFSQRLSIQQTHDNADFKVQVAEIEADKNIRIQRIDETEAEERTISSMHAMERKNRLEEYESELNDAQRQHAETQELKAQLRQIEAKAKVDEAADQANSEQKLRSFTEQYNQWLRENKLKEEMRKADRAMHSDDLAREIEDKQHETAMQEIYRKIQQSDMDWQEKVDAYRRLMRNRDFQDENANLRSAEETKIDLEYLRAHTHNVLNEEEYALIKKAADDAAAQEESKKQADFVRELEWKKILMADELQRLKMQYEMDRLKEEHQYALNEKEEERRTAELKWDFLKAKVESEGQVAIAQAKLREIVAMAERAAQERKEQSQQQKDATERILQREEAYAERGERLANTLMEMMRATNAYRLENERIYFQERAKVDQAAAEHRYSDAQLNELIDWMKEMFGHMIRGDQKPDRRGSGNSKGEESEKKQNQDAPESNSPDQNQFAQNMHNRQPWNAPGDRAVLHRYCRNCGFELGLSSTCPNCHTYNS